MRQSYRGTGLIKRISAFLRMKNARTPNIEHPTSKWGSWAEDRRSLRPVFSTLPYGRAEARRLRAFGGVRRWEAMEIEAIRRRGRG